MTLGDAISLLQRRQRIRVTMTGPKCRNASLGAMDGTLICVESLLRAERVWDRELTGAGEIVTAWKWDAREESTDGSE